MNSIIKKIGILGGTFDPAHLGHIKISKEAKKKFKLEKVYWAVTNKNPFKSKSKKSLNDRINYAKKLIKKIDLYLLNVTKRKLILIEQLILLNILKRKIIKKKSIL